MQLLFSLLLSVIVGMDTLFPMQEVCRLLDIDTSTLYRWCKRAGIAMQQDASDKRRRTLSAMQVTHLAEVHHISLATHDTPQEHAPDEILRRLEAIEQHLQTLHHEIMNLSQALHMQHELLQASQPVIAAQPRIRIPQPRQAPSASSASHRGVSTELVWLEPGVVAWRAYARVHHIGETGVLERIRSGKLPVVQGSWRIDKTLYQQGLNAEGRRTFHALYHLPLPCELCGMD